jgi:hypothetical protein
MLKGNSVLIAPTTEIAVSNHFRVSKGNSVTLVGTGMVTETAVVEAAYDEDTWEPVSVGDTAVVLSVGNNPVTIYGPGLFRVSKVATTDVIGVALWEEA